MNARGFRNELLDWVDRTLPPWWVRRIRDAWRTWHPVLLLAGIAVAFALVARCVGTPDDGLGYLSVDEVVAVPEGGTVAVVVSDPNSGTATSSTVAATVPQSEGDGHTGAATVVAPAERGVQVQVAPPPTPPPTTERPAPFPGDCVSWSGEFVARGATADEIRFFFAGGIIERETGCGRDTLNDATGDTGICQVNPVHNSAGWFGGREFGPGGWLLELLGLRVWEDTDSPEWVDACLTLFRVCGPGPWRLGDWGCANRRLP